MEQLELTFYPQPEIKTATHCPTCNKVIAPNEQVMYYNNGLGRNYCEHFNIGEEDDHSDRNS
jgi:hypothetical protein